MKFKMAYRNSSETRQILCKTIRRPSGHGVPLQAERARPSSERVLHAGQDERVLQRIAEGGFTLIEGVVLLGIITIVSATVLIGFGGLSGGAALNRSTHELALATRRAQNMSLVVTQIQTNAGPIIPHAVGIKLTTANPTSYFTFIDRITDGVYVSQDDIKINEAQFERNVHLNRILDKNGSLLRTVHIIFQAPEAAVMITNETGSSIEGDFIELELSLSNKALTKKIDIRTSGQISIK